jgi:hypothetical protein
MHLALVCIILTLFQYQAAASATLEQKQQGLFVVSYGVGGPGILFHLAQGPRSGDTTPINVVSQTDTKSPYPGWVTLQRNKNLLFVVDEGIDQPNGAVIAYTIADNAPPKEISRLRIRAGGVAATLFSEKGSVIAVPQYSDGSMQTISMDPQRGLQLIETIDFKKEHSNGPIKGRQETSHPHHAVLDPTGRFIVVPDLGSDKVHLFGVNQSNFTLQRRSPIAVPPGCGPRHGAFWQSGSGKTMFYLVGELDSTVTVYDVTYGKTQANGEAPTISFKISSVVDTVDKQTKSQRNSDGSTKVAPAEIIVSVSIHPLLALCLPQSNYFEARRKYSYRVKPKRCVFQQVRSKAN